MATKTATEMPRLKTLYQDSLAKQIQTDLQLKNPHMVPKLEKIVVSVGLGKAKDDKRLLAFVTNTLERITGQKPVVMYAKKSIANFKIRAGLSKVGLKVTLRDKYAYEFLDRLITVVLPRVRDFHGVAIKGFDKQGNYSIGIDDQSVFPELTFEETVTTHGLQITIVVDGKEPKHSYELLKGFGMPFEKKEMK